MRAQTSQSGFSIIELVIVVVVIAVLAFVGYSVYNRQNDTAASGSPTSQSPTANVPVAPAITTISDLDKAAAVLDQTDTSSSSDSAQLDTQLQTF